MLARKVLKRGYVVWIRQETDVENQIAFGGNAVPITEAVDLHQNARGSDSGATEDGMNRFAQLMNVELAGVDDGLRQAPDRLQPLALPLNAGDHTLARPQRMRTPRLAE